MILFRSLLLIALLFAGGAAQGAEFVAKVIAVLDGDTVLVLREGGGAAAGHPPASPLRGTRANGLKKIRLAGIDAPEKAQTFGESSRRSLADMVLGKQVRVASEAIDQYGRMVAHISVDGLDVNAEQIRRGMAWEYSRFHNDRAMLALQEEARREPRGLWALSDPMPPWEWRKLHPSTLSEPSSHVPAGAAVDAPTAAPVCASKKRCSQMTSCEEARDYLNRCGGKLLDGDGDGLPCEQLCAPHGKAR